jgi:hypothetical protein
MFTHMARRGKRRVIIAGLVSFLLSSSSIMSEEKPLSVGITGSTPDEDRKNPSRILGEAGVQKLILEIAAEPRSRAYVEKALEGRFFTVEDMVYVGLLREEAGRLIINFNLLTVEDQRRILAVSEEWGRDLAEAFLAERSLLETLAGKHPQRRVPKENVLFIVLGCFSLDWDGLEVTENRGYRAGPQRTIDGHSFTPWAKEKGADISLRGLYWGSHNSSTGEATFSTFGDHVALPRFGLPDMFWSTRRAFSRFEGQREWQEAGGRLVSSYLKDALEDAARVMFALRSDDLSADALRELAGIDETKLDRLLTLLEMAGYVVKEGETYAGTALVLTSDDKDLVHDVLRRGREIIIAWHERSYETIKEKLQNLTPLRHGVPYGVVYTEVWHFLFGVANRTLVEEGLFCDPYAEGRPIKGFIPAVWANGLSELPS